MAEGYNAYGDLVGTCSTHSSPDALGEYPVKSYPLVQQAQLAAEDASGAEENPSDEETEPAVPSQIPTILSQENLLEYTLPDGWKNHQLEYSVELLTKNEDGKLEYVAVDPQSESLLVEYVNDEWKHVLILRTGKPLPQAGTYRINMNWSYEGICQAETQTTFFINYSVYYIQTQNSQEVPNDE